MQPLKLRVPPTPLQLILAGAMVLSIALALPAQAKTPPVRHSVDAWEISWKVIAGLGLLSGMSALALNLYVLQPRLVDARRRLIELDKKKQNMMHSPDGLIALKNRMTLHEQKAGEVALRISLQEKTYKRDLAEQQASIANLAKQLQSFRQNYLVQSTCLSALSPTLSEPSHINPLLPTPLPPVSYADEVTASYTSAVLSNDRSRIRNITKAELNITQESEDALTRGTSIFNTQLHNVSGGGSYLLIERGSKNWICPTAQTLSGFMTNKPQKGIFEYEESVSISSAELKEPAEVQEVLEGVWEVINKGVVLVPS